MTALGTHIGTRLYTALNGLQVGRDDQGNRYFQERRAPKGRRRKRWVIYNGEREASRVPPEWHGWLHYMVDATPEEAPVARKPWQAEHRPARRGDRRLRAVAPFLARRHSGRCRAIAAIPAP